MWTPPWHWQWCTDRALLLSLTETFMFTRFTVELFSVEPSWEKAMATHSSTLAWKIPWTEQPGRLQSMGSRRVGHDWSDLAAAAWSKASPSKVWPSLCSKNLKDEFFLMDTQYNLVIKISSNNDMSAMHDSQLWHFKKELYWGIIDTLVNCLN